VPQILVHALEEYVVFIVSRYSTGLVPPDILLTNLYYNTMHKIQNTKYKTQNTKHKTQNTKYKTQNTKHIKHTKNKIKHKI
jgi:hypothetical protein